MTGTRKKLRSLFLVVLMVTSVFGGAIAFTGTAAAANTEAGSSNITPATVSEQTTNTHTVTLNASDVDTSDSTDQVFVVDLPGALGTSSTQVTNANVIQGSVTVGSTNVNSTSNVINVTLNDDGGVASETVNVTFDITNVEAPEVSQDVSDQAQFGIDANADGDLQDTDDAALADFQLLTITDEDGASGFTGDLPQNPTDATQDANTAPGRTVQVANVSFGTAGSINNSTVDLRGSVTTAAVDSVTVIAQDNNTVIDRATESYDAHGTTVELGEPAKSAGDINRLIVTANVSSGAPAGATLDADLEVAVNPVGTIGTQNQQTVRQTDTFVRAAVSSTTQGSFQGAEVQFVNADTGTVVAERTTNNNGLTTSVQIGPNQNYTAIVNETGFFEASSNTRFIAENDTEELDVTLVPRGTPQEIEVIAAEPANEAVPADGTSEIEYYVQVTGLFGSQTDVPLNNINVDSAVVSGTNLNLAPATNTTTETTLPNGTSVNGTTTFSVSSTDVQQANISFTVASNNSIQAFAEPRFGVLAGEGTIQGQVIAEDTTSGLEDARVHAVTFDRFVANERFLNDNVGSGDTDYYRVVNSSTGEVVDVDDYRVVTTDPDNEAIGQIEFLNESDKGQGSGFFVQDRATAGGNNFTNVFIVPLEPGDYSVEKSEEAPNATRQASAPSAGPESFGVVQNLGTVNENLTYANAVDQSNPYDEGGPQLADVTDEDGDYALTKLFTDFQQGQQYVVIGQRSAYSTDFVDVEVTESGTDYIAFQTTNGTAYEEGGADENLNLKPREVTPTVNITNIGFAENESAALAGDITAFSNQTDAFEQTIIRDGSFTDVVEVETTAEDSDQPVDATVTIEFEDDIDVNGADDGTEANETNLAGQFTSVTGGSVVSIDNANDTIVIATGSDGVATVFYEADRSEETYEANLDIPAFIRATAEQNQQDPDTTNKRVVGITQFGSISGIVTDEDNRGIADVRVYTDEFVLSGYNGGERVELEPVPNPDEPNPTEYNVKVFNSTNDLVASETVPFTELENGYDFSDFSRTTRTQFGLFPPEPEGFTLATETREDGTYTLPRVLARGSASQFQNVYTTRGVSELGNDGQAQGFPGVGSTDDANIVISEAPTAGATLANLQPDGATVTAGTVINPTAEVSNTGSATITPTVEFGLDINDNGVLDDSEVLDSREVTLTSQETETVTFTADTTDVPADTYTHIASTGDNSTSATITIEDGSSGNGEVTFGDVLDTIDAFNNGNAEFGDVLDAIEAFNS